MRYLFSILCALCLSLSSLMSGQELSVKSLRLAENDLTARTEQRLDANKQPCALLKVQVRDQITEVQGNVVGTIINKGIEKWIYFTDGTKRFRLLFANYPTQDVTVTDYGVPSLRGNCTYELIIAGETLSVAGTQELRLQYSPPDATVLIDNMLQHGHKGKLSLSLSVGEHQVIIAKDGYLSFRANTEIVRDRPTALSISLMKDDKVPEKVTQQSASQPIRPEPQNLSSEPKSFTVNGVTFMMMPVQGGTFTMGATPEQGSDVWGDEKPSHEVTLSDYYIGQTEVTQSLWQAVMGGNPSEFTGIDLPVEKVSWNDCQEFIFKLNELTGQTFRLPTEAEWEYATRGGNKSRGYKYSGSNTIDDVAWYYDNSKNTHPVGTKSPNELGLYDMSGNVWEWCQDWYGSYSSASQTNPTGPVSGSRRVVRGGGWNHSAGNCRVSHRSYYIPSSSYNYLGLRLALDPENSSTEWVDLGLPSGTLWATCNVGADSPEDYGDYFAWGETEPKTTYTWANYKWCNGSYNTMTKYCTSNSYGAVDNKKVLDLEDDVAYVNWGPSWCMPSKVQMEELLNNCTWTWTQLNGVNGQLVTGPNGNTMFLPATGRHGSSLEYVSIEGLYWSRTLDTSVPCDSYSLYFSSDFARMSYWSDIWARDNGQCVRAVRVPQN